MPVVYNSSKAKPKKAPSQPVALKKSLGKKRKHHPLAAFIKRPEGVSFETQEKKEEIILLLRRHWITNLPWLIGAVFMILAPLFLKFFPFLDFLPWRYQLMAVVIWYMLALVFIFEKFLSWVFNVNLVTDERIVDIDFYSLIYKEISHCKIDRIQDVTYRTGGVIRTIVDYGDVIIQTAGEEPVFEFKAIPKPASVVRKINDLIVEEEREKIEGRVR